MASTKGSEAERAAALVAAAAAEAAQRRAEKAAEASPTLQLEATLPPAAATSAPVAAPPAPAPRPEPPAHLVLMRCPKCGHRQSGTVSCESCSTVFETFFRANQKVRELHAKLGKPAPAAALMKCPKCAHEQVETTTCGSCGLVFHKFFRAQERTLLPAVPPPARIAAPPPVADAPGAPLPIAGEAPAPERLSLRIRIAAAVLVLTSLLFGLLEGSRAGLGIPFAIGVMLASLVIMPGIVVGIAALWRRNRSLVRLAPYWAWSTGVVLTMTIFGSVMQRQGNIGVAGTLAATAYIEVDAGNNRRFSGTGFLVRREGDTGWLATNAHVIDQPGHPSIVAVFDSGNPGARRLRAKVIGVDRAHDLALLEVELSGVQARAVPVLAGMPVATTQDVLVIGYPFGEQLATSQQTPAVTVTKGIVSSIRADINELPGFVQVDADINPGNSGGPVISATGQLIGVAVAKVDSTQIGFAIPARILADLLDGGITDLRVEPDRDDPTRTLLLGRSIDPRKDVAGAKLLITPLAQARRNYSPITGWAPVHESGKEIDFVARDGDELAAVLPSGSVMFGEWVAQVALVTRGGQRRLQAPFRLLFERSLPVATGPGVLSEEQASQIASRDEEEDGTATRKAARPVPALAELLQKAGARQVRSPVSFDDLVVGGGGRYLLAKATYASQLLVFDVQAETWQRLEVGAPDFLLAANREAAYALRRDGVLRRWPFGTSTPTSVTLPPGGAIHAMAAGADSDASPLVVLQETDAILLDPRTLQRLPVTRPAEMGDEAAFRLLVPERARLRASADGRTFAWWRPTSVPEAVQVLRLVDGALRYQRADIEAGYVVPAPDGGVLYTNLAGRLRAELQPSGDFAERRRHLVPDVAGSHYAEIVHDERDSGHLIEVQVYSVEGDRKVGYPLRMVEMAPDATGDGDFHRMPLAEDKRYLLLTALDKLVTVPYGDDAVVVRDLGLKKAGP